MDALAFTIILSLFALSGLYRSTKVNSEMGYLVANRKAGLLPLTATLVMTEFNSSTLLAFSSMGYLVGFWALTLPFIFLIGLLFYSLTVAKKWKRFDGFSVGQFFTEKYGTTFGKIASTCLLLAMVGFSSVYVHSLTLIFTPLVSLGSWVLSFLLVGATLLITLRGGLLAIIQTDLLSLWMILVFLPLVTYLSWDGIHSVPDATTILPPWFILSLTLLTMFTYIIAPWYGQKIFAAKDEKTAKKSVFLAALLVSLLYSCGVAACASLRSLTLENPDMALPTLIGSLPFGLAGVGFALLFISGSTTLSGVYNAIAAMAVGDFLKGVKSYKRSLYLTIAFATLSYLLANLLIDQIFQKLILANIPTLALSFALLAGFYWKGVTKAGAFVSLSVGCIWGVSCYLIYGEEGGYQWYWVLFGLPLIFGSGTLVSLLSGQLSRPLSRPLES